MTYRVVIVCELRGYRPTCTHIHVKLLILYWKITQQTCMIKSENTTDGKLCLGYNANVSIM